MTLGVVNLKGNAVAAAKSSPASERVLDFLGEIGARWGLPAEACRVHGYFYLAATPATAAEVRDALGLDANAVDGALAWLEDYRLIESAGSGAWKTDSDPWDLMMRALKERRRREMGPALELLRACHNDARAERQGHTSATQIGKLLRLAEDLAAISRQAGRLSPAAMRQMVGIGGLAARAFDRTFGRREHR